jgi:acyl dehydratase
MNDKTAQPAEPAARSTTMTTKTLDSSPGTLGLYARAAAPLVPGASRLPFVGGRGKDVPDLALALDDIATDPEHLARYARVCEFRLAETLPATYPHVLAFPLHMALMTDSSFPFPAVGLVHLENRIAQLRPIRTGERLSLLVRPTAVEPHPKGRTFSIVTEARVGDDLVWEGVATMLRRGGGSGEKAPKHEEPEAPPVSATWRLDGGLGRRYAAASGDRNPIHMHDLSAKLFGFPRAIAHGMWTKARCLAALEGRLPDAYAVRVRFRKPILLPAKVTFGTAKGNGIRFSVRAQNDGSPHLDGWVELDGKEAA